jgi:hypothetical protein
MTMTATNIAAPAAPEPKPQPKPVMFMLGGKALTQAEYDAEFARMSAAARTAPAEEPKN